MVHFFSMHFNPAKSKKTGKRAEWEGIVGIWRGGGSRDLGKVLISCVAVISRPLTLALLQCRNGARPVVTDQADIASTKREAPWVVLGGSGKVWGDMGRLGRSGGGWRMCLEAGEI